MAVNFTYTATQSNQKVDATRRQQLEKNILCMKNYVKKNEPENQTNRKKNGIQNKKKR